MPQDNEVAALAAQIDAILPQTQCTKCGFSGCAPYALALAEGQTAHDRCPPGGAEGIARIARILHREPIPLDPACGTERARARALIDESVCIGCTLCIQACPVDAIVGAAKLMHTVVAELCTGCELCVAPCPVDCIEMLPVSGTATAWQAWSPQQAAQARARHEARKARLAREEQLRVQRRTAAHAAPSSASGTEVAPIADDAAAQRKKQEIIAAAMARARLRRAAGLAQQPKPAAEPTANDSKEPGSR